MTFDQTVHSILLENYPAKLCSDEVYELMGRQASPHLKVCHPLGDTGDDYQVPEINLSLGRLAKQGAVTKFEMGGWCAYRAVK